MGVIHIRLYISIGYQKIEKEFFSLNLLKKVRRVNTKVFQKCVEVYRKCEFCGTSQTKFDFSFKIYRKRNW